MNIQLDLETCIFIIQPEHNTATFISKLTGESVRLTLAELEKAFDEYIEWKTNITSNISKARNEK